MNYLGAQTVIRVARHTMTFCQRAASATQSHIWMVTESWTTSVLTCPARSYVVWAATASGSSWAVT